MKRLVAISIITFFLYSCCEIPKLQDDAIVIENGGGELNSFTFELSDSILSKLKPGYTFCYYQDNLFHYDYGPNFSNKVVTSISNELITEIKFFDLQSEKSYDLLKSNVDDFSLTGISSVEGLLSFLESNQLTFSIDLVSLINLYIDAMQSSDLSVNEFLEYLLSNGLISQTEYDRLLSEFSQMGLDLNSKLSSLVPALESTKLTAELRSDNFVSFIDRFQLQSKLDLNMIKSSIKTGKPVIVLRKIADKSKIWFGGTLEYTLNYENIGGLDVTNLVIIDCLPLGVCYEGLINSESPTPDFDMILMDDFQILVFEMDESIPPNSKGIIKFRVKLLD